MDSQIDGQSLMYNPEACKPIEGHPKCYCGRALHNPDPTSPERCWVELYGFCVSALFLDEYYDNNVLWSTQLLHTTKTDTEIKTSEAIRFIRKMVACMLNISYWDAIELLPTYTIMPLPPCSYTIMPLPPCSDGLIMSTEEKDGSVESLDSLYSVVIYWATNEHPDTMDRLNGEGTMFRLKDALRDALDLGSGAEPTWWPEQGKVRFPEEIPAWSPYYPKASDESLSSQDVFKKAYMRASLSRTH
ncbi:hypothetical protein QCA50_003666 [Cerrena zonata]|uniref:Uncharacterized protein n=1 Tax=Cerrena zonata TaxID=2478898 RepID=A0AAW0GWT9_9APHY